jgi:hypothetical protein
MPKEILYIMIISRLLANDAALPAIIACPKGSQSGRRLQKEMDGQVIETWTFRKPYYGSPARPDSHYAKRTLYH